MKTAHRTPGSLYVVSGATLNAIADLLDADVPLAGEGLDFIQDADGRTFFIPGAEAAGGPSGGKAAINLLPSLLTAQVTPGRALNQLTALLRSNRGFAGSGVGMKAGTRGRIFSVAAPFVTPPFPPPDPPIDPSSDDSGSPSGSPNGSGSGSGSGPIIYPPDPDDSSSSSSSGS